MLKNKLIIILIILISIFIGVLIYIKYFTNQKPEIENQDNLINIVDDIKITKTSTNAITPTTPANNYTGWKTYTNNIIGYNLKYPQDWSIDEIDGYSELIQSDIKYITINSPDGKYFLQLGIKKQNDNFKLSDRTGIGAGDLLQDTKYTVKILQSDIVPTTLSYNGKIKEIFWNQSSNNESKCSCNFDFNATYTCNEQVSYENFDMTDNPYLTDVIRIIESVNWNN